MNGQLAHLPNGRTFIEDFDDNSATFVLAGMHGVLRTATNLAKELKIPPSNDL
jgi:hypothetical protein